MEKIISLGDNDFLGEGEQRAVPLVANNGQLEVDDRLSRPKVKTAAAEEALAETYKVKPRPDRVYLLVIGLGSEEFWGINNNGDSFPENALLGLPPKGLTMGFFDRYARRLPKEWGFKTFLKGHTFEEHRNTHPKFAIGGIENTFWNNRMHRVENLIWIDRSKGKKWADRADRGETVGTSMACRVPFDRCSLCNNLAPTRAQYCAHLRPGSSSYQLRQIREDGKGVSMINDFPDFFDESCVETPAAPEALSIMKVASEQKEAQVKEADITKDGPDLPLDVNMDDLNGLYQKEREIHPAVLDRLSPLGMPNILRGASILGICFRPSELFHVYFGHGSVPKEAALELDRKALLVTPHELAVEPISKMGRTTLIGEVDSVKVARAVDLLKPYAAGRSYEEPYLTPRLMKSASVPLVQEPLVGDEHMLLGVYHTIYKAASGQYGYGHQQAKLAHIGRFGDY